MQQPNSTEAGPHQLVRPNRLVPAVTEALVRRIVSGEFAQGDYLPRESELIDQYGVSRTVIRETVRVLEEKGMLVVQQGRGTTVLPRIRWNLLDPIVISVRQQLDADYETSAQLVAVRAAVEGEMARVAAERFGDTHADELGKMLASFEGVLDDGPGFLRIDRAFHEYVIDLAGNEFAAAISRSTHAWVVQPAQLTNERLIQTIPYALTEHHAIFQALRDNDGARAATAMRGHIQDSWTRTYALLTC